MVEAGMSPSAYQDLGVRVEDGDDTFSYYNDYHDPDIFPSG